MAVDAAEAARNLPPWLEYGANAALFILAVVSGAVAMKKGRKEVAPEADDRESFDAAEFLDGAGPRRFLANVEALSVAAALIAKIMEEEARDRRVHREAELLAGQARPRPRKRAAPRPRKAPAA